MSRDFNRAHSRIGCPGIPPEQLLKALLLRSLYSVPSERKLMEAIGEGLLSEDHFTIDGTLIRSMASLKSLEPIDDEEDREDPSGGRGRGGRGTSSSSSPSTFGGIPPQSAGSQTHRADHRLNEDQGHAGPDPVHRP
jgi:hypothetical protein